MGESRTDLLHWINDLLDLSYTKIEQMGTGAAIVQIFDSIFRDVPMNKIKFNAKHDYEYLANFKVLQEVFKKHKVDKPIPVERLVRCKMQDNLEFVQWVKKYWDMHYPGGDYDPVARRKGVPVEPVGGGALSRSTNTRSPTGSASGRVGAKKTATSTQSRGGAAGGGGGVPDQTLQVLTAQMGELKLSVEGLEKERDFYFNKLRDIEISIGARVEGGGCSVEEEEHLKSIQAILYSTEEGFEVPEGGEELAEEETF